MGRKVFAAIVAALFAYVAYPLIFPVAMGGVLAVLFIPFLERLEKRRIGTREGAALVTLGTTLLVLMPTAAMIFFGAKSGFQQLQSMKPGPPLGAPPGPAGGDWFHSVVDTPKIHSLLVWITDWFPVSLQDLVESVQDLTRAIGLRLADLLGQLVSHLPGLVMALAVVVVSLYFFLVDGRRVVLFLRRNSVFSISQTDQLMHTLEGMCRSVILASVVSGGAQAVIEMIVCLLTGTPNAALIGMLTFMGSFIPVVGSLPITLAVAGQAFLNDQNVVGVILLIAAFVVMGLDNVIRPMFLKGAGNLHPFLAFVAALGGLQTLGFLGVFLGPIVAAMFMATIQILMHPEDSKAHHHHPKTDL